MTAAVTLLRAVGHRVMPWKNGGGSTTEIAVSPADAGLDDFDWRISMAVVAADGPFSSFPGVERTLAVLDGAGLLLHGVGTNPQRLDRASPPFAFPADAAASATLVDGAITDLNVMTRRGRYSSHVRRLDAPGAFAAGPGTTLLLAEAPCRVAVDGGAPGELRRRDVLRLDGPAALSLAAAGQVADGPVAAFLVEIRPDGA